MYRLVIQNVSLAMARWLLLGLVIGVPLVIAGVVILATTADRKSDWNVVGIGCLYPGGFGLIAGFFGLSMYFTAVFYGEEFVFEDEFTIRYAWPRADRSYSWDEIERIYAYNTKEIERKNHGYVEALSYVHAEDAITLPATILGLKYYNEKVVDVGNFRVAHKNGKTLAKMTTNTTTTFQLHRWQNRRSLSLLVKFFGGSATWKGDSPQAISLRDAQFAEGQWDSLKNQWLRNLPGLEELDLSGTNLRDEDLHDLELEAFPTLQRVEALNTRISRDLLNRMNAQLAARHAKDYPLASFLQAANDGPR